MNFGGPGIGRATYGWIEANVPKGSTVVELGAGNVSTQALSLRYDLYSVENDIEWIDLYPNVHYILAPLEDGWYSRAALKSGLPPRAEIDFVLVDGPAGSAGRPGVLRHLNLFPQCVPWLLHDAHRLQEHLLAANLAGRRGLPIPAVRGDPEEPDTFAVIGEVSET